MKRVKLIPAEGGVSIEVWDSRAEFLKSKGWREEEGSESPPPKSSRRVAKPKPSEEN